MAENENKSNLTRRRLLRGFLAGAATLVAGHTLPRSGEAREDQRSGEQLTSFARDEDVVGELDSEKYIVTNLGEEYKEASPASGEVGFRLTSSGTGWPGPSQQEGSHFYVQGQDVSVENVWVGPLIIIGKDGRKAIKVPVDSAVYFSPDGVAPAKASLWIKDTNGQVIEKRDLQSPQTKSWQASSGDFFIPLEGIPNLSSVNVSSTVRFDSIGSFGVDLADPSGSKTIQFTATREVVP